jgi:ribosomal protein L17
MSGSAYMPQVSLHPTTSISNSQTIRKATLSQWPSVSRETVESWCEKAKQLRVAIDPVVKVGKEDRLGQLKPKYESVIALTMKNMARNLEKVALLQDREYKALYKIVRCCAELWLECCSQRHRIIVVLASRNEDVLGISEGNTRLVKLVLKPALRKPGNAQGGNLMNEEVVVGWKSEASLIHLSEQCLLRCNVRVEVLLREIIRGPSHSSLRLYHLQYLIQISTFLPQHLSLPHPILHPIRFC